MPVLLEKLLEVEGPRQDLCMKLPLSDRLNLFLDNGDEVLQASIYTDQTMDSFNQENGGRRGPPEFGSCRHL